MLFFLRLEKLFERGRVQNVIELLIQSQKARVSPKIAKLWSEALLSVGELEAACDFVDQVKRKEKFAFWLRFRAYCNGLYGDIAKAELNAQLAEDTGEKDPVFNALLLHMTGLKEKNEHVKLKTVLHWSLAKTLNITPGGHSIKNVKNEIMGGWLSDDEITFENKLYALEKLMSLNETELIEHVFKKEIVSERFQTHLNTRNKLFSSEEQNAYFDQSIILADELNGLKKIAAYYQIYLNAKSIEAKMILITKSFEYIAKINQVYALSKLYQKAIHEIPVSETYQSYAIYFVIACIANSDFDLALKWSQYLDKEMKQDLFFLPFMANKKLNINNTEKILLGLKQSDKKRYKKTLNHLFLLSALGARLSPQTRIWLMEDLSVHMIHKKTANLLMKISLAKQDQAIAETFLLAVAILDKKNLNKQNILVLEQIIRALSDIGYQKEAKQLIGEYIIERLTEYTY